MNVKGKGQKAKGKRQKKATRIKLSEWPFFALCSLLFAFRPLPLAFALYIFLTFTTLSFAPAGLRKVCTASVIARGSVSSTFPVCTSVQVAV